MRVLIVEDEPGIVASGSGMPILMLTAIATMPGVGYHIATEPHEAHSGDALG